MTAGGKGAFDVLGVMRRMHCVRATVRTVKKMGAAKRSSGERECRNSACLRHIGVLLGSGGIGAEAAGSYAAILGWEREAGRE